MPVLRSGFVKDSELEKLKKQLTKADEEEPFGKFRRAFNNIKEDDDMASSEDEIEGPRNRKLEQIKVLISQEDND